MKDLKHKLSQLFSSLTEENERTSNQSITHFLQESYQFIERKLKNREYTNGFSEYLETDLLQF